VYSVQIYWTHEYFGGFRFVRQMNYDFGTSKTYVSRLVPHNITYAEMSLYYYQIIINLKENKGGTPHAINNNKKKK
jgi:hypothetical protein